MTRQACLGQACASGIALVLLFVSSADAALDLTRDWSTYLGGSATDYGCAIAVDSAGCAYVTGYTTGSGFPTTTGAYCESYWSQYDSFVSKLKADGSGLEYSTYLGGDGYDYGYAIAVDTSGNVYVGGNTASSNFPRTAGAYDTTRDGDSDGFVAKLNSTGSALSYSTLIGGSSDDYVFALCLDDSTNAYVTGTTNSTNFPTTSGVYDTTFNLVTDAFATKLNAAGSGLLYSTYLGGSANEEGRGVALETSTGKLVVVGRTASNDFPRTASVWDTSYNGGSYDGFVVKLTDNAGALDFGTYVGGSSNDAVYGVALDSSSNVYVAGETQSSNFPGTTGAYDTTLGGTYDAFLTKLLSNGSAPVFSSLLGGASVDTGRSLSLDDSGNAYVSGRTMSSDFPTTASAFQTSLAGSLDAFLVEVASTGDSILYGTYLGGTADENVPVLARMSTGELFLAGDTASTDFPTTPGVMDTTRDGARDLFVAKFAFLEATPTATPTDTPSPAATPSCLCHASDYRPSSSPPGPGNREADCQIDFSELLRAIQLYNIGHFHCDATTEDGYAPGAGSYDGPRHSADYWPASGPPDPGHREADWTIDFPELLRLIQLYNSGACHCDEATEDGYAPGVAGPCACTRSK